MSFEDDLKFANDVLRIRNEMIDETIFDGLHITTSFFNNFKMMMYSICGLSERGKRNFGDISTSQYTLDDSNAPSVVTSKSIVYIHDDNDAIITIGREQMVPIIEYDEALHFQHSLLYTPKQLRMLVTLGVLRANPIIDKNGEISARCLRFKIYTDYIPMITKLLRYKDNGII